MNDVQKKQRLLEKKKNLYLDDIYVNYVCIATASLLPSECYKNNLPYSILTHESMATSWLYFHPWECILPHRPRLRLCLCGKVHSLR